MFKTLDINTELSLVTGGAGNVKLPLKTYGDACVRGLRAGAAAGAAGSVAMTPFLPPGQKAKYMALTTAAGAVGGCLTNVESLYEQAHPLKGLPTE